MSNDFGKFAEKIGVYVAPGGQAFIGTQNIGGQKKQLRPFQAPPLPTYYVDRPEYSQDLKIRLLTEPNDARTLVVTAIHGLASVGKSTLAIALARDQEVQSHFSDGILWAILGQQPNLLSLLSGWVQALGDNSFKATSVEAASNQLRTLLYDKCVLLVVDDAWNPQDAQAFNVGGARCQVLVTTREAVIADVLGASTYSLDVMTPEQAMELLTNKLGREIIEAERQSASDLAKAIGYLPLALELVAAEIASGTTWTQLLEDFQQEVARLKTLDRPEAEEITDEAILKRFSLTASLNLSVKRMPKKKQEHFSWLGVLPEDVNINKMMAATLWKMDVRDTAKTLQYLQNKALLLSGVPLADGTPTYRLHDLFHDLARNLLTAPPNPESEGDLPGLGITLPDAHATFLKKYRQKTQNGLWHTLLDDGYIHQHLIWHLEKAGQIETIHQMLKEESKTGNNGWYEVREALGQTSGYLIDVTRAWELAEEIFAQHPSQSIALQYRYALITTSVNSLAKNIPTKLVVALVEKGFWTPNQGIAYAQEVQDSSQLLEVIKGLIPFLPTSLLPIVLNIFCSIQDNSYLVQFLSIVMPYLPGELLPEVFTITHNIQNEYYRAQSLIEIASRLPEVLPEAISTVQKIQDDQSRNQLLIKLLPLCLEELLPEALNTAEKIQDDLIYAETLINLAILSPNMIPELIPKAFDAVRKIQDDSNRIHLLKKIAPYLNQDLIVEALNIIESINFLNRAQALIEIASYLPIEIISKALVIARSIQSEYFVNVESIKKQLPQPIVPSSKENKINNTEFINPIVFNIIDGYSHALNMIKLATYLPDLRLEALTAVRNIQIESNRTYALIELIKHFPELKSEALTAARNIDDNLARAKALVKLANYLPELSPELSLEALITARTIQDNSDRTLTLIQLIIYFPGVASEALDAVSNIQDKSRRIRILGEIIPHLPPEFLSKALAITRNINDISEQVLALIGIGTHLPKLVPEVLAIVYNIQNDSNRADILGNLIPHLPPELLSEALIIAHNIQDDLEKARALICLVSSLPEVTPEILAIVHSIKDDSKLADILNKLLPYLPPEFLSEFLAIVRNIQNDLNRADILLKLLPYLPEILPESLEATHKVQNSSKVDLLIKLAFYFPDILPEALAAARELYDLQRVYALSELAFSFPQILPEALDAVNDVQADYFRVHALIQVASYFPAELPKALDAARNLKSASDRAYALRDLILYLPEVLPEALDAAHELQSDSDRFPALIDLARNLQPDLLPKALGIIRGIQDNSKRAMVYSNLLASLNLSLLEYPLWSDILHNLSHNPRSKLLEDTSKLSYAIIALGGIEALTATVHAIQDICRQWR